MWYGCVTGPRVALSNPGASAARRGHARAGAAEPEEYLQVAAFVKYGSMP